MRTKQLEMTKENVLTKQGEVNNHIVNAIENCKFTKQGQKYKVHYGFWTGSGRWMKFRDYSDRVKQILDHKRYKYTEANDARQGGAEGQHLIISKKAYEYLMSVLERAEEKRALDEVKHKEVECDDITADNITVEQMLNIYKHYHNVSGLATPVMNDHHINEKNIVERKQSWFAWDLIINILKHHYADEFYKIANK